MRTILYFGKTLPQYLNGVKVFNIALRTDSIEEILYEIENDVQRLGDMAQALDEVGGREFAHLEKLAKYTKVSSTEELH